MSIRSCGAANHPYHLTQTPLTTAFIELENSITSEQAHLLSSDALLRVGGELKSYLYSA
jgi:hypothetical protein